MIDTVADISGAGLCAVFNASGPFRRDVVTLERNSQKYYLRDIKYY
jgi:hypothetical protein